MKDYYKQTIYENPPVGQWYIVLKEHFLERAYDVYMLCDNEDGTRIAFTGENFTVVQEGVEAPLWLRAASEQGLDDTGVLNAFQHVYKISERLVRVEP